MDLAASLLGQHLAVVLYRPKYAENVGAVARACLNTGCERIILVDPRDFDQKQALPLATVHAAHLLKQAIHVPDLPRALSGFTQVYGTTARLGGWRRHLLSPAQAAANIARQMHDGHDVALLFGPEDRGLGNAQIETCSHLVHIPTARMGVSLNLAQAVLILLYECLLAASKASGAGTAPTSRHVTHAEQEVLFDLLKQTLTAIDFIKDDNPDYWMLRVRRLVQRMDLRREEFNVLMGVCRQVGWAVQRRKTEDG
ncbi:MAG TPA: RNA methyltransferase [Desulfonatronum sp.]|nr:RNA methyltransferase [Desulfonatronum sp.]